MYVKNDRFSMLFRTFAIDIRKFVKTFWKKKSVIDTRLYNQILAKFEHTKRLGCNNAHATDIYNPERENYILALGEWLLLILLCGQCEKPDCRDKQNTVLTLFAFINLAFQRGMRSNANFYEDIKIYRNGYFRHYYER